MSGILSLLQALYIPTSADRDGYATSIYDGHTIALRGLNERDLLHESCHFVVATPEERTQVEYGMGPRAFFGDNTYRDRVKNIMPREQSQIRECAALLLHERVGTELGIGMLMFKTIQEFMAPGLRIRKTLREDGQAWLAEYGVDLDRTAALMVEAYRS